MGSFSTVSASDDAVSSNVNQFAEALGGQANIPISITGVNDASLWALDVKNADATNARTFRAQDSSGTARFTVGNTSTAYVQADPDGNGLRPVVVQTNSTFSLLAGSSNTVKVPQCRLSNTSSQTLASGVAAAITFNNERWDNDGLHSTTTTPSRITPSRAGLWDIGACIAIDPNSSGPVGAYLFLNGATYIAAQQCPNFSTNGLGPILTVQTKYQLSTSDYVEVQAFQQSGGNLGTVVSANRTPEFWASFVGST